MTKRLIFLATFLHFILLPLSVHAQLSGANTKGDYGLLAGTQAPPGFYVVPLFYDYTADTLRNRNGDSLAPIELGGSINIRAAVLGMMWVSEKKILGGNYSFVIWPGVTNNAEGFPPAQVDEQTSTGLADLYIQPFTLGWSMDQADFIAGLGVFAPTGNYEVGGDNNRGLGMWSYELFGASTVYFDEARTWSFATIAAFETHSKKEGTDVRVGNLLTLEGGLGKSFKNGAVNVGIAYYAQWKLTDDDFGLDFNLPGGPLLGRNRVYAFGPEISIPIASKKRLYGFLDLRYLWETGARTTLEGNTFVATFSFPVPSIALQ